ncbi:hypothetical protein RYX36_000960, partial [Vicia faba]
MAVESQARGRGVSEDTFNDCVKNIDCVRKWHCDLGLVPLCIKATYMAIESQARGRGVSDDTFNDCVKNIDCVRKWHCDLGLVPLSIKATCIW